MVRIESKATELDRPWEEMVQAVIQKYPNPHSKSARVSDIISRHVNSHGHVVTERYSGNKEPGAYSSKTDLLGLRVSQYLDIIFKTLGATNFSP